MCAGQGQAEAAPDAGASFARRALRNDLHRDLPPEGSHAEGGSGSHPDGDLEEEPHDYAALLSRVKGQNMASAFVEPAYNAQGTAAADLALFNRLPAFRMDAAGLASACAGLPFLRLFSDLQGDRLAPSDAVALQQLESQAGTALGLAARDGAPREAPREAQREATQSLSWDPPSASNPRSDPQEPDADDDAFLSALLSGREAPPAVMVLPVLKTQEPGSDDVARLSGWIPAQGPMRSALTSSLAKATTAAAAAAEAEDDLAFLTDLL